MGDLLDEDDALEASNILYRCLDLLLDRKSALFSHLTKLLPPERRLQSLGEEIANSLTSGIGLMAVIAGIPLVVGSAIQRRNEFSLAGAIVFAAAMVTLQRWRVWRFTPIREAADRSVSPDSSRYRFRAFTSSGLVNPFSTIGCLRFGRFSN